MQNLRVLVVDDSDDDTALLLRTLQRAGFCVTAQRVQTREGMLAALDASEWDIVFVDWILPQFSAPDAIRILRGRKATTPCIVISGVAPPDVAVLAIQLGANDFIPKANLEAVPTAVQRELMFGETRKECKG